MRSLISVYICLLLIGCGSSPKSPDVRSADNRPVQSAQRGEVGMRLIDQYQQWEGVPYRLGGLSKRGVDCSGFVHLTYLDQFGVELPRTTRHQAKQGRHVPKSDLNEGDLVFFKTGFKVRHVGIYLGYGQFLHASTSKGVTVSDLDSKYWRDAYWQARRVPIPRVN